MAGKACGLCGQPDFRSFGPRIGNGQYLNGAAGYSVTTPYRASYVAHTFLSYVIYCEHWQEAHLYFSRTGYFLCRQPIKVLFFIVRCPDKSREAGTYLGSRCDILT